ncbi:MAG TPA: RIO1 family regulatory kinase/ATPase [Candidatus Binatus sp.]|nr:RIO1 family regulatory kinase/ATPase [Candidatus Binatus sp.]
MTTALEIDESLLDAFIGDGSITDVLYVVRSGKEATVYCCRAGDEFGGGLVAAKLYRPLERRNFRNEAIYAPGHDAALSRRDKLALHKKTRHGRDVQYGIWINAEFQTLRMLHAAGAEVPEVLAHSGGAILMEYFGDEDGAAPMLNRATLPREEADKLLRAIIDNVTIWLGNNVVHGDLSPYNLLYWNGRIVAIDFPQAVDPRINLNARSLLERDLENVCAHFTRYGIRADAQRIANALWINYKEGRL